MAIKMVGKHSRPFLSILVGRAFGRAGGSVFVLAGLVLSGFGA
jgi:hypothetical protein